MDSDDDLLEWTMAWSSFMRMHLLQQRRNRINRRLWMRPVLRERDEHAGRLVEKVLEEETDKTLISLIRISREDFHYLLSLITPKIRKQDTVMRAAITARDKFIITLKFLAAGDDYKTLELNYRVSKHVALIMN